MNSAYPRYVRSFLMIIGVEGQIFAPCVFGYCVLGFAHLSRAFGGWSPANSRDLQPSRSCRSSAVVPALHNILS